ncbi:hypothetical protein F9L33_10605 [Amylibacter sp. SFDW26]|uniref:hypothetical protein n=1 Tax=Amylibacter sp. SFDW26 TaxID=2652722 RepID=UPI00126209AE|nr:hypothetical protein [Amylibacter sp. SFDW26]KAB7613809.1 hypothetical protein F9L33_10605 [Amylibacter sp. SFDW26]
MLLVFDHFLYLKVNLNNLRSAIVFISKRTEEAISHLFETSEIERVKDKLEIVKGIFGGSNENDVDRCQLAVLKLSNGNLDELEDAIKLYKVDARDLVLAAGFPNSAYDAYNWLTNLKTKG